MQGYKYTTETEAIAASQTAADYMGFPYQGGETLYWVNYPTTPNLTDFITLQYVEDLEKALGEPIEFDVTFPDYHFMKLPITFEQFKSDPSKAIMFLLLGVVSVLYYASRMAAKQ
jgi:hypothetical protein